MWPKHNDVWKFAILGALDCHRKMAALLPEAQTRTVANGLPHKLRHLRGSKSRLPLCAAQTVHSAECLRDRCLSGQRRQKRTEVGV